MFSKRAFPYIMSFWSAFGIVLTMCIIMSLVNIGTIAFPGIIRDIALGTAVAYSISVLLPVSKWADGFATLCKAKPGTLAFSLLGNVIFDLFIGIPMTFLFTALAIGFPPYYLFACLEGLPLGLGVGYVASAIVTPVALKLTMKMCTKV